MLVSILNCYDVVANRKFLLNLKYLFKKFVEKF